jgi:hypothetical protein
MCGAAGRSSHLCKRCREAGLECCIVICLCSQLRKASLVQHKHAARLPASSDIASAHEERVAILIEECEVGGWFAVTQGRQQQCLVFHIVLCLVEREARDLGGKVCARPAHVHTHTQVCLSSDTQGGTRREAVTTVPRRFGS